MTTITLRLMFLPVLFDVGWCYYQHMWWMFYPHIATWEDIIWLMLLPYMSVADVITTEADVIACYILFYFIIGWCYCQYVADVIATFGVMWWQMLLPSGRCYGHCRVGDGWWLILLPPGRWYCQGSMMYFNLSSGMLNRTSSHICGRWYLPTFLLRDGLLTLMYRAYFITLLRFWSFLPTMLKFSTLMLWPVVLKWSNMGEGAFWCSLNLSPKVLEDSPIYSSSHSTLPHL